MASYSSEIRYECKPSVANWETDAIGTAVYRSRMSDVMAQWVRKALQFSGISQTELARQLTDRLNRSFDKAAVNKMVVRPKPNQKPRGVKADEMYAIADITGFPPPDKKGGSVHLVPLLSWVSAGRLADPGSVIHDPNARRFAFSDLGAGEFFALSVSGDSMDRISPDGSIIIVNREDRSLISGRCYVFSILGETTYKRWQGEEPPHLEPYSTNPTHKPHFLKRKRELEVVGRVRRTVLDL